MKGQVTTATSVGLLKKLRYKMSYKSVSLTSHQHNSKFIVCWIILPGLQFLMLSS